MNDVRRVAAHLASFFAMIRLSKFICYSGIFWGSEKGGWLLATGGWRRGTVNCIPAN